MSLARTGSVGARAAPSRSAAARPSPRIDQPRNAIPAIVRGMAMPRRRHDDSQPRQLTGRSSFRPAPIRATMITNSVRRSVSIRFSSGFTPTSGENGDQTKRTPIPMQTIGSESGSFLRNMGSQAVRSTIAPKTARRRALDCMWLKPLTACSKRQHASNPSTNRHPSLPNIHSPYASPTRRSTDAIVARTWSRCPRPKGRSLSAATRRPTCGGAIAAYPSRNR